PPPHPPSSPLFPYTTLFRSLLCQRVQERAVDLVGRRKRQFVHEPDEARMRIGGRIGKRETLDVVRARAASGFRHHEGNGLLPFEDRKSTRLNSSHVSISYAV